MTGRRRLPASSLPMPFPMGVMEISAPSWKNPIPTMSISAPTKNMTTVPNSSGTSSTLIPMTISVIGTTAARDSFSFSISFGFKPYLPFC